MRTGDHGLSSQGIRSRLLRNVVPLVVAPVVLLGVIALVGIFALRSDVDGAFDRTTEALASAPGADSTAVQAGLDEIDDAVDTGRTRLALAVVATLVVASAAAMIGITLVARRLVGPIRELAVAARRAADEQLPETVAAAERINPGQPPPRPDPIVMDTGDELQDLASAVNTLQSTAVELAVGEALTRRQRTALFLNLGRRNQNLVSKQLEHLDEMEREETDPVTLDGLLRLDHLATRMRRNAENLLVFAGLDSPRRWTDPVAVRDVIRAAAAEIKDYERVELADIDDVEVRGDVASDIVHLLAELLENAANFSSPGTAIEVFGRWRDTSYAVSVVDHGLGMTPDRLAEANRRLARPAEFTEASSTYMGLFVVGKLAARHGMVVRLIESPFEGTTAKVTIPDSLLVGEPPSEAEAEAAENDDRPHEPSPPVSIRDRDPGRIRAAPTHRSGAGPAEAAGVEAEPDPPPPVPAGPQAPQPDAPRTDAPQPDAPQPEAPQPDTPRIDAPQPDAPRPEAPQPDAPVEVTASGFHRRRPGTARRGRAAAPSAPAAEPVPPTPEPVPPTLEPGPAAPVPAAEHGPPAPVADDEPAAPAPPAGPVPAPHSDGPVVTRSGFVRRRPGRVAERSGPPAGNGTSPQRDGPGAHQRRSRFGSLQAGIETGRAARSGGEPPVEPASPAADREVDAEPGDGNDDSTERDVDESAFGSRRWWES